MAFQITTDSEKETQQVAARLAKILKPNAILCLFGDLGTGKTTFVKGMAKALRIKTQDIQSPTFVLMRLYEGTLPVYHFDLYRLEEPQEIQRMGLEDYFYDDGISIVEWADRLGDQLPQDYIHMELTHQKEHQRLLSFCGHGPMSEKYVQKLKDVVA